MPASLPISAKEESHRPRWPIASFSTSPANAGCASIAMRAARASFAFIKSSPAFASGGAPSFFRQLYHQPELCLLHFGADRVAGSGGGEPALRADSEAIERDVARGFVEASLQHGLILEKVRLGRNEAEHDRLALRNEAQRREVAGTLRIVFEEEEFDRELVEQFLGHGLVASFRVPLAGAIAAAKMHANADARDVREHAIGNVDVLVDQRVRLVAARAQARLHVGVAELRERRLVDLHTGAARGRERTQLAAEGGDD